MSCNFLYSMIIVFFLLSKLCIIQLILLVCYDTFSFSLSRFCIFYGLLFSFATLCLCTPFLCAVHVADDKCKHGVSVHVTITPQPTYSVPWGLYGMVAIYTWKRFKLEKRRGFLISEKCILPMELFWKIGKAIVLKRPGQVQMFLNVIEGFRIFLRIIRVDLISKNLARSWGLRESSHTITRFNCKKRFSIKIENFAQIFIFIY